MYIVHVCECVIFCVAPIINNIAVKIYCMNVLLEYVISMYNILYWENVGK